MANTRLYNRSFAGGEISPEMFGRIDDARYQTGAKTVRNFVIKPQGAARSRPGMELVAETKYADKETRLIPFVFNNDQAYVLELGDQYVRWHLDGAPLTLSNIRAFQASSTVTFDNTTEEVTWTGHNLQNDDPVIFTGGTMPTELSSGTVYYVSSSVTNKFKLRPAIGEPELAFSNNGSGVITGRRRYTMGEVVSYSGTNYSCIGQNNSVTPPATQWYALSGAIYELPTQFQDEHVMDIHYVQSGDVMTLVHPSVQPTEISRLGQTMWTVTYPTFENTGKIPQNVWIHVTPGSALDITSYTPNGNSPETFRTGQNHGFAVGQTVYIRDLKDVTWTVPSSKQSFTPPGYYQINGVSGNEFSLRLENSLLALNMDFSAGTWYTIPTNSYIQEERRYKRPSVQQTSHVSDYACDYIVTSINSDGVESLPSSVVSAQNNLNALGGANCILWDKVDGAISYNVYKKYLGSFGLIGQIDEKEIRTFFAGSGGGAYTWPNGGKMYLAFNHRLTENQPIMLTSVTTGSLPGNILYFVRIVDKDHFYICETIGGKPVDPNFGDPIYFTTVTSFTDDNIAPDFSKTNTLYDTPSNLSSSGNYPSAVTYFEQRRMFAGTLNDPQTFWGTRTNTEGDLGYHIPSQSDDRIKFKVSARNASQIRHLVPTNNLMALTSEGEWRITSVDSDALTPSTASVRPQSYIGANNVQPQVVNSSIVYCANRGGHVRELGYNWQQQTYVTGDLSVRAAHLFDPYELVDMAYSKAPQPVVWFASSSGKMLAFTYIPEENVGGWSWHETNGSFKSLCAIPEGEEDRLYAVIRRGSKQFVERMAAFEQGAVEDYVGLDCSVSFDGANTAPSHTLTISGGTNWTPGESLTLTMVHHEFAYPGTTDIGDAIVVTGADGTRYRLTITGVTSQHVATATTDRTIPTALRNTATANWSWARNSFTGLSHLNGFEVVIFADGVALDPVTVTGGAVSLATPAAKVCIGLPYVCDLETIPVAMQIDGFGQGRVKNVNRAWIKVYQSSGISIGPNEDELVPMTPYRSQAELKTMEVPVLLTPSWADNGSVLVRQDKPLPATILGMTTEIAIGG